MEVAIIEDEDLAAEKLTLLLREINPDIKVKQHLKSVEDSIKWLHNNQADLLLLDIDLSDDLSFNIFKKVQVDIPVIFTTAYDEYAIKAFEQNSIAYLLKPIDKIELEKSLEKYGRLHKPIESKFQEIINQIQGFNTNDNPKKKRISVNYGGKMRSIAIKDVAYFHVHEKAVYLKTFDGSKYIIDETLDALSQSLDDSFFRVNRRFLVNMDGIEEVIPYSSRKLKILLNVEVPEMVLVSTEKITPFKRWFNGF